MASTVRTQAYREKLKEPGNEERLEEFQRSERANSSKYFQKTKDDKAKYDLMKKRKAETMKRLRAKWKDQEICKKLAKETSNEPEQAHSSKQNGSSFTSRTAKSRALNKTIKSLPNDREKKAEIVRELAKRTLPSSEFAAPIPKKKPRKAFVEVENAVNQFYQCDLVSRENPGAKDCITIKNANGENETVSTFTLRKTLKEAHQIFTQTFPNLKISYSKFCDLRPKNVKLYSDTSDETCLCHYCENTELKLESLSKFMPIKYTIEEIRAILLCHRENEKCSFHECSECFNVLPRFKKLFSSCCEEEILSYKEWTKEKDQKIYVKKTVERVKVSEVISLFEKDFNAYRRHIYMARVQKEALKKKISELLDDEALVIFDFAEKYTIKFKRPIQGAHWDNKQITLFTVMIYTKGKSQSMIIVSDDPRQTKEVVFSYIHKIVSNIQSIIPNLRHVIFFSDGCAGQFKNRFNFLNLLHAKTDHGITIEWHYFATGHGKSACDGIGGCFKKMVYRRVISDDLQVDCAKKFIETAQSFSSTTILFEMTTTEIDTIAKITSARWGRKVKRIPGTQNFHHFYLSQNFGCVNAKFSSMSENFEEFYLL